MTFAGRVSIVVILVGLCAAAALCFRSNRSTPSPLIGAIRAGDNAAALQIIGDNPRIVYARDENGLYPLMWAAMLRNEDVVRELLARGVDVNLKDSNGETALYHALLHPSSGRLEMVRFLLQAGADPMITSEGGRTMMDVALADDDDELLRILEAYGGRPGLFPHLYEHRMRSMSSDKTTTPSLTTEPRQSARES